MQRRALLAAVAQLQDPGDDMRRRHGHRRRASRDTRPGQGGRDQRKQVAEHLDRGEPGRAALHDAVARHGQAAAEQFAAAVAALGPCLTMREERVEVAVVAQCLPLLPPHRALGRRRRLGARCQPPAQRRLAQLVIGRAVSQARVQAPALGDRPAESSKRHGDLHRRQQRHCGADLEAQRGEETGGHAVAQHRGQLRGARRGQRDRHGVPAHIERGLEFAEPGKRLLGLVRGDAAHHTAEHRGVGADLADWRGRRQRALPPGRRQR